MSDKKVWLIPGAGRPKRPATAAKAGAGAGRPKRPATAAKAGAGAGQLIVVRPAP